MSPVRNKVRDRARKKAKNQAKNRYFLKRKAEIKKIRKWDDPVLKEKCEAVEQCEDVSKITEELKKVLGFTKDGVGLAASQLGYKKKIIALRLKMGSEPVIMINPEIIDKSDNTGTAVEGCLSYPGVFCRVERNTKVKVKYLDESFKSKSEWKMGHEGIVIQHEIDHTLGICKVGEHYFGLTESEQTRIRESRK